MTARSRKILRDLRLERTRTLLVVLAIALGIAAFSAVLDTYGVLTRELRRELDCFEVTGNWPAG